MAKPIADDALVDTSAKDRDLLRAILLELKLIRIALTDDKGSNLEVGPILDTQ